MASVAEPAFPIPFNEGYRCSVLASCGALGEPLDPDLQRIVRQAARRFEVPMALVPLVDTARLWFAGNLGLDAREAPREIAFCAHTIVGQGALVVPDTREDARFHDNPLVVGPLGIRFYAGVPLVVEGAAVGTLCLLDTRPRQDFDAASTEDLADFAGLAASVLRARRGEAMAAGEGNGDGTGTVRRQAAEELEQAQALALLSHELRTPLNAVLGFADLIAEEIHGPLEPTVYRGYAVSMRDGGRRLEALADRLLGFTEVLLGQVPLQETPTDVRRLAERALDLVRAQATAAGVELVLAPSRGRLLASADQGLLEQALFQILRNAVEHGSPRVDASGGAERPTVTLAVACDAGRIGFTVQDQGRGLSQAEWQALLRPFQAGRQASVRGDTGNLGLGLALAERLMALHGGSLSLDEAAPGDGCRVRLTLPAWRLRAEV